MATTWTNRPPISYTQTLYDDNILYDTDIRYDGVIINNTQWTNRPQIGVFTPYTWDQSTFTLDSITFTWDTWGSIQSTQWTNRIKP